METIFNLAPIICVLMTFLSLANVAAAIASDNRKYAKIFTAFVVIYMVLSISSMRVEESPLCMWEVEIKSFNHKTKISIELPEDAVYIHWGDCVYFVSFGKNVFGFNCLFPKVIDRMYYTEVHAMQKEERAIREHEKECLASDDKGFYIKRIGKHDFIVNYQHEANNPPVHDPGCPCGWIEGLMSKDTIPNSDGKRATIGAARGCKPGYTRHTYVLPQQMIDQVKAVAQFFCCSEVSAAEQILQKGLDDIQKSHGTEALTLKTTKIFG